MPSSLVNFSKWIPHWHLIFHIQYVFTEFLISLPFPSFPFHTFTYIHIHRSPILPPFVSIPVKLYCTTKLGTRESFKTLISIPGITSQHKISLFPSMPIKLYKNTSIYLKNKIKAHFLTLPLIFTLWNNNHVILVANHEGFMLLVTKPYPYPGGLPSMRSHRVGHDWSDLAAVAAASHIQLFVTPWTVAHQASPSMGFPRQEHWSRLQSPSPGDLPNPGMKPRSPILAGRFFTTEPSGKLYECLYRNIYSLHYFRKPC